MIMLAPGLVYQDLKPGLGGWGGWVGGLASGVWLEVWDPAPVITSQHSRNPKGRLNALGED